MYNTELIKSGDIIRDIISFIRATRTQYNITKNENLRLFIDIGDYKLTPTLLYLCKIDSIINNIGNIKNIEYDIFSLLKDGFYFEHVNIEGYNIYLELPSIDKDTQEMSIDNEINRLTNQAIKLRDNLSSDFIKKAPKEIIDKEYSKLEFNESKIESLKSLNLYRKCGLVYYNLLNRFGYEIIGHFLNYDITPENILELNKKIYK